MRGGGTAGPGFPGVATRLRLAWPASLGEPTAARRVRASLVELRAGDETLRALLGAGTLPGAADAELVRLGIPAGLIPALPPNPLHPRPAVDALLWLLPAAAERPGGAAAGARAYRPTFLDTAAAFSRD